MEKSREAVDDGPLRAYGVYAMIIRDGLPRPSTSPLAIMKSPWHSLALFCTAAVSCLSVTTATLHAQAAPQEVVLDGKAGGKLFEGIGVVNGGGATSVLLKDYPEPQRSQILDLVYKPKFGASVSALLVEIPGDGNSTQGSMPSHMHSRDDLDYTRGYTWWILDEAHKRNPNITLDAVAWSAPGWIGGGKFWSQDMADYYVKWLQGLRDKYGLELDALGCRNESGVSFDFVKMLRKTLNANGFAKVRVHGFDNWRADKLDFVKKLVNDKETRDSMDIISAHILAGSTGPASPENQKLIEQMGKPLWNTEDHVYKKGYDCLISIVECFNNNYILSGVTRVVNWYDIAGIYPIEPFPSDPPAILAYWPWSGHYRVREALWGYAHYGQFSAAGWTYLKGGSGPLAQGGTFVTLKSPGDDYSIIIETKKATGPQTVRFQVGGGLSTADLCVWRSNPTDYFVEQTPIKVEDGGFTITLDPQSVYSLSTTRGQQKGSFADIPAEQRFPLPYREDFESYTQPAQYGQLPRYFADIEEVFELRKRPDGKGMALRQVSPMPPLSWTFPQWRPYSIIGDEKWKDYEISADVYLGPGDAAGVMGRVNHVGTGFGTIPKGYFLQLGADGGCDLIVVRGKEDKKKLVGDAEQQAIIRAQSDDSVGGEKVLAHVQLPAVRPNQWHRITLRMDGAKLTTLVDGKEVASVENKLYTSGMAGIVVGRNGDKLSMPYFDNIVIKPLNTPDPAPTQPASGQTPIYGSR